MAAEARRSSSSDSTHGPQEDGRVRDFFRFAKWAFSSEGLPNLQALAYGDFSCKGPYARFNLILCKERGGYRTLTEADSLYWKIIDENKEMLAACPADSRTHDN